MTDSPPFRIGVILPMGPEYAGRLLEGAIAYAEQCGEIELLDLPYRRGTHPQDFEAMCSLDGALVWLREDERWADELIRRGVVVVNTSGDRDFSEVPLLAFDRRVAIEHAVEHLASLDRRQAVFVGARIEGNAAIGRRVKEFQERIRMAGINAGVLDLQVLPDEAEDRSLRIGPDGVERMRRSLKSLNEPAAVWCDDDFTACFVCEQARAVSLEVPGDVAVLGFHDYRVARMSRPAISSIPQPGKVIGHRAVEWIHEGLRSGDGCQGVIGVPCPPVEVRESTIGVSSNLWIYRQARATIREYACRGITVSQLMQGIPLSQPTFSKRFAELFGRTPGAEIRQARLEKARLLLRSTELSVERIAELSGFEQPGKFSTFFKRETGDTPSAFRRMARS